LNVLETAKEVIIDKPLCESCLGRCFARLGRGLSNRERGAFLKGLLLMEAERLEAEGREEGGLLLRALAEAGVEGAHRRVEGVSLKPCYVCGGLLSRLQELASAVREALAPYEFSSFLLGTKVPGELVEREDSLRAKHALSYSESLKSDVNRELRRLLSQELGKRVDFTSPDVMAIVDVATGKVEVKLSPVFIYGRYLKLEAGIPQSRWLCPNCWGRGCTRCGGSGKLHPISVEELIAKPLEEAFEGRGAKFHGAGREDVDVKVLGRGRPFVVEVREPRKRNVDLLKAEEEVNRRARGMIEVRELRFSSREEVRRLKVTAKVREKTYLAKVRVKGGVKAEEARRLEEQLSGALINQRTPLRVLHRRADKVRVKKVYELKVQEVLEDTLTVLIRGQGGLYVKELVTGDEGRTTPSIAELLGREAEVVELTVIDVE
jgi:tRNA pseudouridine synthase 10